MVSPGREATLNRSSSAAGAGAQVGALSLKEPGGALPAQPRRNPHCGLSQLALKPFPVYADRRLISPVPHAASCCDLNGWPHRSSWEKELSLLRKILFKADGGCS